MIFGYRMEAISILGREVMQPHGLVGLGFDSLDTCGPEIADVSLCPSFTEIIYLSSKALRVFTEPSNYGVLVHCTQGKDRTGLIIALVLLLLEVPVPAITHDYILSEAALLPEREARMKEISEIGLTEDFAGCPRDWVEKMDEYLRKRYDGVKEYLKGIGFGNKEQEALVGTLEGSGRSVNI